jgi:hypothetical protein
MPINRIDSKMVSYDNETVYDKIGILNEQVKTIEINLANYPRLDGETTDDGRFNRAIADLPDGGKLTLEPFASYTLNTIKFINKSNITINFNHSTINFTAKASNNSFGEIGVLNFHGTLVGGDAISYIRSVGTSTHVPPAEAPVLQSIEPHEPLTPFGRCSKVRTSNNDYFNVGDYIWLMGWSRANRMPYDSNLFEPEIRRVAKVIAKDASYLYIDYYTPWTINCVDVSSERSRAMKVNPIKNIKIENINMVDQTTLATPNSPTSQELKEALSGISALLVDGLTINGFNLDKPKYPALYLQYSRNINLKNIYAKDAQMLGGGQGYLVQFIGCSKGTVVNADSYKCRHTVDFSWSDNFYIEDARGQENYERSLSIHGICEHDLFYKRCKGGIAIGSGISYFPEICGYIQIEDSDIVLAVDRYQYIDKLYVKNSKVYYYEFPYSVDTTFENCDITASMNINTWEMSRRGKTFDSKMKVLNSTVKMYNIDGNQSRATGFFGVDYVTLDNVELSALFDASSYTTMPSFRIFNAKEINIKNVKHNQISFGFTQNAKDLTINYIGSKFWAISQNSARPLNFDSSSLSFNDCTIILNCIGSEIKALGTTGYIRLAYLPSSRFTNCFVVLNIKDNVFIGNPNHTINFTNELAGAVVNDRNNIIRYATSGHHFNTTNNTILSS